MRQERDALRARLEKVTHVLDALDSHAADFLAPKADYLKTTDAEGWAIGELVERYLAWREQPEAESEG